jgi:hypothetical protein
MSDFSIRVKKMPDESVYSPEFKEEDGKLEST